jgi:hypothetical protein
MSRLITSKGIWSNIFFGLLNHACEMDVFSLEPRSSHFHSGYFGDRVLLFVQAYLDHDPILCFWTSM